MKFYKRDPDRALAGMSALNPPQRGIYNSVIDLLYSRDGMVACMTDADDHAIARNISVPPQTWRKFKAELLALGKIRITTDGRLTANGVEEGINYAETRSDSARKAVTKRWENYRLARQFNNGTLRASNTIQSKSKISELPSPLEHGKAVAEESGDNDFGVVRKTTGTSIGSGELEALLKAKGWR